MYLYLLFYFYCFIGVRCLEVTPESLKAKAECGTIIPKGNGLIIDGVDAQSGEIPWHVGVYRTNKTPYEQICGGSLVSTTVVISGAHCFWREDEKLLPASRFALAVGKVNRLWEFPNDANAQTSEVSEIHLPPRFYGATTNYQDDIAIVIAKTPFRYSPFVRPVCLDFEFAFDELQLKAGKMGKIAGWNFMSPDGVSAGRLQVAQIPYVDIDYCISNVPLNFREYITSDKFCAGNLNSTTLCKGDSGGGLAFPEFEKGVERYYLRGIASTAPRSETKCAENTFIAFTHILKHENFIKKHL